MKTERNIFIAFILNLGFAIFEFIGGTVTGSVSIVSDAIHDLGDALSIGISFFLEKKSRKQADEVYTYGYARYSILGGFITTVVLLLGSLAMIYNAIGRIISPVKINYNGMIIFAIVGVCVNSCAIFFTREGDSLNQKAVNLHMLEDALGWIIVLIGAVVMRFTDFALIDPMMSIGLSVFILVHAIGNLKEIANLFLEKTPSNISISELKEHIGRIDGVLDVHHIHVWSIDGQNHSATLHIVAENNIHEMKEKVRDELYEHGIVYVTIETETEAEHHHEKKYPVMQHSHAGHCHHHHHH